MKSSIGIRMAMSLFVTVVFFACPLELAARGAIPDDNLAYPVLITLEKGSFGSGFYLNTGTGTYLVTARHVLLNAENKLKSKSIHLLSQPRDPNDHGQILLKIALDKLEDSGHIKSHPKQDIVIVLIGKEADIGGKPALKFIDGVTLMEKANSGLLGVGLSTTKKFEQVLVSNEVLIFGYPNSLGMKDIPQIDYKRPLLRKGIVAGKNEKMKTIILDCPSYPGNSGGLVLEIEQVDLLNFKFNAIGVVTQFVPFAKEWINIKQGYKNLMLSNSGYSVAVPMDAVLELVSK